jgi:hypothetical protein
MTFKITTSINSQKTIAVKLSIMFVDLFTCVFPPPDKNAAPHGTNDSNLFHYPTIVMRHNPTWAIA